MKKPMLTLSLLLSTGLLYAQSIERQVIGSSGGYSSTATASVSSTVGETVIATGTSGSFVITQGFQQPDNTTTGVKKTEITVDYKLYPNPAQNSIMLSLKAATNVSLNFYIYDAVGRLVHKLENDAKQTNSYEHSFDIASYSPGNYLLKIRAADGKLAETIPFTKQ